MRSSSAGRAVGVALGAVVLQLLMIIAFGWPAARVAPRDVPIAVAGPQAEAVASRLDRERPGAFEITIRADEAAARADLTGRAAYGAIVTTPSGPRVLVASAASPVVAQLLGQMAATLGGAPAAPVQDVVATDPDDPRGSGFGALALPLVMSALAAAVLFSYAVPAIAWRAAGLATFAVLGGLAVTALAQGWLSVLEGPYLGVAGVMALTILAVSGTVAGLAAVLGRAGPGVGALTFLLVGNPLSGATSAPELLPQPWGLIGQYLPPGASATLLRSVAFYDGATPAGPLLVLTAWAVAGLALLAAGAVRGRAQKAPADERRPVLA
ncbi:MULTISPECIES: hypothetical protein [Thermomonosporaceae]|uniref:hypothetical protein n=1 Tax=Thermomonosporaceae TaxID=2012 RepID=UPI00255A9836|nr:MULTISPECIES: hypothetical protein [Thermomonosporaceae]MDL4771422.1 hypothetical protein [Actinomadura xylanilytica]